MATTPGPRVRTRRLYHVFAPRRSGHHAIIWWLRSLLRAPNERLNNCSVPHTISSRSVRSWPSYDTTHFEAIVMNYEDRSPALVSQLREDGMPLALGIEADETTVVMVLRDPYNNLASKRRANPERDRGSLLAELEIWKAHAREFLGLTDHLRLDIRISYNEWFADAGYRTNLSTLLKTDYLADGSTEAIALNSVPRVGQSTFDRKTFDGRAQEMDVLKRWRRMLHDSDYVDLFRDRETHELADRIFQVEGVEELRRLVSTQDTVARAGAQENVIDHGA